MTCGCAPARADQSERRLSQRWGVYLCLMLTLSSHRVECDGELVAPGDGDVRFGASLHADVSGVRAVLHIPENAARGSADLHLLRSG